MTIRIEYSEMPPKELRGNSRAHWRAKLRPKENLQNTSLFELRGQDCRSMGRINVKYITYWCGKPIDRDKLIIGRTDALDCSVIDGNIEDVYPNCDKSPEV